METGAYYFVKNLPLHELITQEFINTFVKKGKKTVVSVSMARRGRTVRSYHNTRAGVFSTAYRDGL